MISLCTDGEKCTKLADQGKCCKATCASISNINTFCNGLTPIDKTLLDSTYCVGTSCSSLHDRFKCCEPLNATCSNSISNPKEFCGENEDDFQMQRLINSSVTALLPNTTKIATNVYLPKCYITAVKKRMN